MAANVIVELGIKVAKLECADEIATFWDVQNGSKGTLSPLHSVPTNRDGSFDLWFVEYDAKGNEKVRFSRRYPPAADSVTTILYSGETSGSKDGAPDRAGAGSARATGCDGD